MSETIEEYVPLENDVVSFGQMPDVDAVTEDGQTYDDTGREGGHSGIYLPSSNELIEEQKRLKKKPTANPAAASLYVQGRQKKSRLVRSYAGGPGKAATMQKIVPASLDFQEPEGVEIIGIQPERGGVPLETEQLELIEPNIVSRQIRLTEYATVKKKNTDVASGDIEEILSQTEDGELVSISVSVDNPNAIVEIATFGDSDTYIELNAMSVDELIADGNGLTPGDVKLLPNGESPDRPGENDGVSVYVARYKADVINTWVLNGVSTARACYVVKYRPQLPFPYKALSVSVRNNASSTITVYAARVLRILHTITEYEVHEPTKVSRINEFA